MCHMLSKPLIPRKKCQGLLNDPLTVARPAPKSWENGQLGLVLNTRRARVVNGGWKWLPRFLLRFWLLLPATMQAMCPRMCHQTSGLWAEKRKPKWYFPSSTKRVYKRAATENNANVQDFTKETVKSSLIWRGFCWSQVARGAVMD